MILCSYTLYVTKKPDLRLEMKILKNQVKFSTQPSAATTSMHCVHQVDFVLCLRPFLWKKLEDGG